MTVVVALTILQGCKDYSMETKQLKKTEERKVAQSPQAKSSRPDLEKVLAPLCTLLPPPQKGEWIFEHPEEKPQSFEDYLTEDPTRKTATENVIYIGRFGKLSPGQERVVNLSKEYLEIFFQTPVRLVGLENEAAQLAPAAKRQNPLEGQLQYSTKYLRDHILNPKKPQDALAYMAITATDLWPGKPENPKEKEWNFVFGEANYGNRTGVSSMARSGDPSQSPEAFQLCLRRTLGTISHEIGHMMTIHHCQKYNCSMNGSNSLPEADAKPLSNCALCERKLIHGLGYDPVKRYRELYQFAVRNGLAEDAKQWKRAWDTLLQAGYPDRKFD